MNTNTDGVSAMSAELCADSELVRCGSCNWHGSINDVILDRGHEDNTEVCPLCGSSNLNDA